MCVQSATKTQLLSSRFQSLLAARDQVIHQLVDKEDLLKKELQNKSRSEERLIEEKEGLLKVGREGGGGGGGGGGGEKEMGRRREEEGGREDVRKAVRGEGDIPTHDTAVLYESVCVCVCVFKCVTLCV